MYNLSKSIEWLNSEGFIKNKYNRYDLTLEKENTWKTIINIPEYFVDENTNGLVLPLGSLKNVAIISLKRLYGNVITRYDNFPLNVDDYCIIDPSYNILVRNAEYRFYKHTVGFNKGERKILKPHENSYNYKKLFYYMLEHDKQSIATYIFPDSFYNNITHEEKMLIKSIKKVNKFNL